MKTNKTQYKTPRIEVLKLAMNDVLSLSGRYETDVNFTDVWGGELK